MRIVLCTVVDAAVGDDRPSLIVGGKEGEVADFCPPCGVCRQVLREFCDPDTFTVILAKSPEEIKELTLGELLPFGFGRETMKA